MSNLWEAILLFMLSSSNSEFSNFNIQILFFNSLISQYSTHSFVNIIWNGFSFVQYTSELLEINSDLLTLYVKLLLFNKLLLEHLILYNEYIKIKVIIEWL